MSGVGLKTVLRVRLSAHDAHYGGGLVDGARVLGLFGDVATELLVRLDGDEGLFRAYESVEFLAPLHAGDFVEAEGEIGRRRARSPRDRLPCRRHLRRPGGQAARRPPLTPAAAVRIFRADPQARSRPCAYRIS